MAKTVRVALGIGARWNSRRKNDLIELRLYVIHSPHGNKIE